MNDDNLMLTPRERAALERTGAVIVGAPSRADIGLDNPYDAYERTKIEDRASSNPFIRNSVAIMSAPPLTSFNGIGVGLYGWLHESNIRHGYIKLYFVTLFWIPIIPLCAYSVDRTGDQFRFYRHMSLIGLVKTFGSKCIGLYFSSIFEGAAWLAMVGTIIFSLVWLFSWF